ncbi:uncharacterized protein LOC142590082 isoform X3 [Dermacentor variabilis]|uniref:uncharacterized protein LOC142590082 isoform X3 n=1 Tax=Dermacentor variabilis TaxID=34621 RepID=UPI003F5AF5FE
MPLQRSLVLASAVLAALVAGVLATSRPVIGILAQEVCNYEACGVRNQTYIAASYVKFVEQAGARVAPILFPQCPAVPQSSAAPGESTQLQAGDLQRPLLVPHVEGLQGLQAGQVLQNFVYEQRPTRREIRLELGSHLGPGVRRPVPSGDGGVRVGHQQSRAAPPVPQQGHRTVLAVPGQLLRGASPFERPSLPGRARGTQGPDIQLPAFVHPRSVALHADVPLPLKLPAASPPMRGRAWPSSVAWAKQRPCVHFWKMTSSPGRSSR